MEKLTSLRIAHFINPILLNENSELGFAQRITFESIENALRQHEGDSIVQIYSIQYPEDRAILPSFATPLPDLERSIQDIGVFGDTRKLPMLSDMLDRMRAKDADYYIYTNIDISLQPSFYDFVIKEIKNGHDAFMINRRRIPFPKKKDLSLNHFLSCQGKSHPGFDCFVFSRSILEKMIAGDICLGVPFIEATLAYNLFAFSNNFKLFDRENLTFHLGMEIMKKYDKAIYWHNRNTFFKSILPALWPHLRIQNFPYSERIAVVRWWKWVTNPALFTIPMIRLYIRSIFNGQSTTY